MVSVRLACLRPVTKLDRGVASRVSQVQCLHLAKVRLVRLQLVHLQVLQRGAAVKHLQLRRHVVQAWSLRKGLDVKHYRSGHRYVRLGAFIFIPEAFDVN